MCAPPTTRTAEARSQATSWLPDSARDVLLGLATGIALAPRGRSSRPRWAGCWTRGPARSLGEPLGAGVLAVAARAGRPPRCRRDERSPSSRSCSAPWRSGVPRAVRVAPSTTADVDDAFADLLPRSVAAVAGRWWVGYAVAVGLALRPHPRRVAAAALAQPGRARSLVVPALALALALRRLAREERHPRAAVRRPSSLPDTVRRASGSRRAWPRRSCSGSLRSVVARGGRAALGRRDRPPVRGRSRLPRRAAPRRRPGRLPAQPRAVGRVVPRRAGLLRRRRRAHLRSPGRPAGSCPSSPCSARCPSPGAYPWVAAAARARPRARRGPRRAPVAG